MNNANFLEIEIPFDKLEKIGISLRSLMSMPQEVKDPFMAGRITPLLMSRYRGANGRVVRIPMKLQLLRDEDGSVTLMTYQVRKKLARDSVRLNDKEKHQLYDGETLRKDVRENGKKQRMYVQLDHETNSLILRNAASVKVAERLREMEKVKDIELGTNQKQAVMEGKPIELSVGDQKVTVGVDLREPQGFKVVNGDMREWERQMRIKYDHEHDGFMGYVLTDENRWEYQRVVECLSHKQERKTTLKKEERRSHSLRL